MKVIGYWLLVIGMMCSAQAELSVSLKPEVESRFVYEPFTLLLEASRATDFPEIPSGGGFSVVGITPIQPGKPATRFRIEIIAEQSGILTVPPITLKSTNETVETAPLRLAISAPRRAGEMELSFTFSSTNLFVDQPVEMIVTWSSKVPFLRCHEVMLDIPLLHSPDWDAYPLDPKIPEKERMGLPVNSQRVIAGKTTNSTGEQLTFSYVLIPRKAGSFRLAEARLSCALMETRRASSQYPSYFDNHFFNVPEKSDQFERIYLSTPLPQITVQPLPEEGRTLRYSGIVGDCTAVASIQPAETIVGQPILLTVLLSNLTFGPHINALPDTVLEGMGSEFQIKARPMHETATANSRSFTYVFRPLRSGITAVPALAFQIFDPAQKTYRIIRTQPLSIRVDSDGGKTVYQPFLSEKRIPKTPLTGIQGNRNESRLHMNTYRVIEFVTHNAWAFWLLPPLIWLALRPGLRRLDRCRTDPAYARAVRAARIFRCAVKKDEESAWKNYLADRFDLNGASVTFETVAPELKKQNVSPELHQAVRDRFARQDTQHYAPQGTPPRKAPSASELVRKLEKATRFALLLVCLLPAFRSDGATPDALFQQAMKIRIEQPDQAQPGFVEAALGFEIENQFLNAGNSWFFAGENGRALANYRAAERRNPFDRQTRQSIAFICAQRLDNFQTLENSTGTAQRFAARGPRVWAAFCRWAPSIRIGLLTLVYLTGWGIFLTARFIGKTVARRVWIALGISVFLLVLSLLTSFFQPLDGVVVQATEARLGPGYAYEKAYETILHPATEFQWLEEQNGWIQALMADGSEAWLREIDCMLVR